MNPTVYNHTVDVFMDDLFMALVPLIVGLVLCIIFGETWRGIWKFWKVLAVATLGLIVGSLINMQLVCTILALVLYLVFSWKWARKKLFGTWKRTLITIAVIAVALFLFWLFL